MQHPHFTNFLRRVIKFWFAVKNATSIFFGQTFKIELNHQVHKLHKQLIIYIVPLIKSGRLIDYNLTQTEKLGSSDVKLQSKKHRK